MWHNTHLGISKIMLKHISKFIIAKGINNHNKAKTQHRNVKGWTISVHTSSDSPNGLGLFNTCSESAVW
jgi:hypothetical protein